MADKKKKVTKNIEFAKEELQTVGNVLMNVQVGPGNAKQLLIIEQCLDKINKALQEYEN